MTVRFHVEAGMLEQRHVVGPCGRADEDFGVVGLPSRLRVIWNVAVQECSTQADCTSSANYLYGSYLSEISQCTTSTRITTHSFLVDEAAACAKEESCGSIDE